MKFGLNSELDNEGKFNILRIKVSTSVLESM